jgi:hypothetical protein
MMATQNNLSGGVESRHAQSAQPQGKQQAVPAVGSLHLHGSGSSAPPAQNFMAGTREQIDHNSRFHHVQAAITPVSAYPFPVPE